MLDDLEFFLRCTEAIRCRGKLIERDERVGSLFYSSMAKAVGGQVARDLEQKALLEVDFALLVFIEPQHGFGGAHIEYVNRWFDQIVRPHRPRAIVFYASENDLAAGKSVDEVVDDFDAFMERKSAVLGRTPVYFISLKPSKLRLERLGCRPKSTTRFVRAPTRAMT